VAGDVYRRAGVGEVSAYALVRTPIDLEPFFAARQRAKPSAAVRGPALAVAIGALERRKRHVLLVEELAPSIRTGELELVICGDGPERARLEETARRLGVTDGVRLLGHVPDVADVLATADVLVHASRVEGVSRVLLQALAAGVPVVTTCVEGIGDLPGNGAVTVVDRSGAGLAAAVRAARSRAGRPVAEAAFADWRPHAVDDQLREVRRRIIECASVAA
jgi:teichuronic acid biosynthesis glycosyltransferase TuaC